MKLAEIKQFAASARIDISDKEAEGLSGDLEVTLRYIDQMNEISISDDEVDIPLHRNVTREDVVTTVTGSYTDLLLAQVIDVQDNYVKVKKIL